MPSYEEVTQREGSLRSMTGLTETEFQALLPHFEQALLAYMGHERNRFELSQATRFNRLVGLYFG